MIRRVADQREGWCKHETFRRGRGVKGECGETSEGEYGVSRARYITSLTCTYYSNAGSRPGSSGVASVRVYGSEPRWCSGGEKVRGVGSCGWRGVSVC